MNSAGRGYLLGLLLVVTPSLALADKEGKFSVPKDHDLGAAEVMVPSSTYSQLLLQQHTRTMSLAGLARGAAPAGPGARGGCGAKGTCGTASEPGRLYFAGHYYARAVAAAQDGDMKAAATHLDAMLRVMRPDKSFGYRSAAVKRLAALLESAKTATLRLGLLGVAEELMEGYAGERSPAGLAAFRAGRWGLGVAMAAKARDHDDVKQPDQARALAGQLKAGGISGCAPDLLDKLAEMLAQSKLGDDDLDTVVRMVQKLGDCDWRSHEKRRKRRASR